MLQDVFAHRVVASENGLTSIDCRENPTNIIEKSFHRALHSYSRKQYCADCEATYDSSRIFVSVNYDLLGQLKIHNLQKCVKQFKNETICECGSNVSIEYSFNDFIMIDLEFGRGEMPTIKMSSIPNMLSLIKINYILAGCVEFDAGSIGHYVAHVKRKNNVWETYDDTRHTTSKPNMNALKKIQILFYKKTA